MRLGRGGLPRGPGWRERPLSSPENFPDTLNCAQVQIFSQKKCKRAYPGKVNEGMVCAGNSNGADTCQVSACPCARLLDPSLSEGKGDPFCRVGVRLGRKATQNGAQVLAFLGTLVCGGCREAARGQGRPPPCGLPDSSTPRICAEKLAWAPSSLAGA